MFKSVIIVFCLFIFSCTNGPDKQQKKIISTDSAPAAIGVYSQGIQVGNTVYVSGQIGLIPETRELAGEDLESQTRQTIKNIEAVLAEVGYSLEDVVSANVFISDMNNYAAFNKIYVEYFPTNPPTRAVVEVSRIPLDALVEIKVIAAN